MNHDSINFYFFIAAKRKQAYSVLAPDIFFIYWSVATTIYYLYHILQRIWSTYVFLYLMYLYFI